MAVKYVQLVPGAELPDISDLKPFRCVVIVEEEPSSEWQAQVSEWLVEAGCLYMMAWGKGCSSWDDSVDYANMKRSGYNDIPEEQFIMTTWHEDEPLKEVFVFSKNDVFHPCVGLPNTLILHISQENREDKVLAEYARA